MAQDKFGKGNQVIVKVQRADPRKRPDQTTIIWNTRTTDGIDWMAELMGGDTGFDGTGTASRPKQLAIGSTVTAPTSADTNLLDELSADGLSRATGTYAHTADQSSYTLSYSWQYTGASTITVRAAAMASALTNTDLSDDTHFLVAEVSPVAALDSNDTLSIDWGVFY